MENLINLEGVQNEIKLNEEFISFLRNYCEMGQFIRTNISELMEEQERLKQILVSIQFSIEHVPIIQDDIIES